jgi:hypothetical protein
MYQRKDWKIGLLALLVSAAISGCVVVPDQGHYAGGVVMVAPPPLREEVIGVAPEPGYVWIAGYWSWVGGRHEWVEGHWARGRPGYHWVRHVWVRQGDGWRMHEGHWERGGAPGGDGRS